MVSSISGFVNFDTSSISQMRQNIFNKIDQNSDGSINKTEMQNILKNSSSTVEDAFAKLDTDDDAAISMQEFDAGIAKLQQEMKENGYGGAASVSGMPPPPPPPQSSDEIFSSLDTDGDGYVTVDELKAAHEEDGIDTDKLLSEIDTDGDGKISKSESDTFLSEMQSEHSMGIAAGPPPPLQNGEVDSDTLFSNLDTDKDGNISKAEWDVAQQNMVAGMQNESLTGLSENNLSSGSSEMLSRFIEAILSAYSGSDTASSESNSVYA